MNYNLITPYGLIKMSDKGSLFVTEDISERAYNALQYMIDQVLGDKGNNLALSMKCIPVGETKKRHLITLGELFGKRKLRKPRLSQKSEKMAA